MNDLEEVISKNVHLQEKSHLRTSTDIHYVILHQIRFLDCGNINLLRQNLIILVTKKHQLRREGTKMQQYWNEK